MERQLEDGIRGRVLEQESCDADELDYLRRYLTYDGLERFQSAKLKTVYIIRRPMLFLRYASPTYAWFVWEVARKGKPIIDWID